MIKSLSINNYALIKSLEMTPSQYLNIITGETGAGKSIMLGAVGLLLGNRADTKALFSEGQKCIIEGVFKIKSYKLHSFFESQELDYDDECIVRREISPSGKARGFINDTPVTLDVMRALGERLMDIHSQHQSLDLGNNRYQREILDLFAGNESVLQEYQTLYESYKKHQVAFESLSQKAIKNAADNDYQTFLFNELDEARLVNGEQEALEAELKVLEHAEEIKTNLAQVNDLLEESEIAAINQIKESLSLLSNIKIYAKPLNDLFDRLNSTSIELKDIIDEFSREQELIAFNPERIQIVKDRVDLIFRLEQKHQVSSLEALINIRDRIDAELQSAMNLDEDLIKAKKAMEKSEADLLKCGKKLSATREKAKDTFSLAIENIIQKLGIENGKVAFELTPIPPSPKGLDQVEMLFSANKGISPASLKQVASGGEFSRLIFAVKFLIADKTSLPTIIFDEIDTGVSGEVALQMINMMKEMSKNHQVIAISHLPQFAAGGDAHYFVYKDHSEDKSISKIKTLENEERVLEIAKMIGGNNPGEHALVSARELLSSSH